MDIRIDILNASKSLLGFDHEILYYSDKVDEDDNPIIEQYSVFSIGFLILTIVFTRKRG